MKFDPTDQEILEHLEAKVRSDIHKLHPLIDEFIPTLEGENGICYTHPEKLPGQLHYKLSNSCVIDFLILMFPNFWGSVLHACPLIKLHLIFIGFPLRFLWIGKENGMRGDKMKECE